MSIYEHLDALKNWHLEQGSPSAEGFLPPLKSEAITRRLKAFPYPVPKAVQNLYRWHNGLKDNLPLFREFTLYPLEEALAEYELACELSAEASESAEAGESAEASWRPSWLPIMGFMGDHLAVDCDPQALRPGHIWFKSANEEAYPWYDSFEQLLLTLRSSFEQGAYFFDEDEILSEDWEAANQIREQLNPYSARIEVQKPEPIEKRLETQPDGSQKMLTRYSAEDYSEEFYGPDQRKTGKCEYSGGQLVRRDVWTYLSEAEVEIHSENLMGMLMVTKTRARITPEGRLEVLDVQHLLNGQPLFEPDDAESDEDDRIDNRL